jgi:tetratricopeptide (TPR) repeat protein/predicted Ser/Thr protein kinase
VVDTLDESLKRARDAVSPAVDPVADNLRARVREALVGAPPEAARVGRFMILETIGRGGMGAVYAAHDPVLDRKVALKLIRAVDDAGRERVLREARALARLAHPNVVAVHEVDSIDDVVYIAMELVTGGSLRAWAAARRSRYDQILRAYVEAGHGLAAAHAAGIVHGDVKPDNLVVGADGRARIIDFGMARSTDLAAGDGDARGGTPAYMAPEQLAGQPATEQSDQFGFCAALYEALYGERPFAGATIAALAAATAAGEVRAAPPSSRVPAWLRRVILTGLATDPAARHPSMAALVQALSADQRKRRRWAIGLGALVVGAAGGVVLAPAGADEPRCDARARLGDAWSAGRRDAVTATLGALSVAPTALVARLDAYAASWRTGYDDACRATHVRGEQSTLLLDLRVHCLDQRRLELDALTAQLASPQLDAAGVTLALTAAWELPDVAACADTDALARGVPLPPGGAARARLDQLIAAIAGVRGELAIGRPREALVRAEALVPEAPSIDHPGVRAQLLDLAGDARRSVGDFAGEEAIRRDQVRAASAARDSEAAAAAWLALAECVARNPLRLAAAGELVDVAEIEASRFGANDAFVAQVLTFRGQRARDAGDNAAARAHYQRALELREKVRGPDHPDVAMSLINIAGVDLALGKAADALVLDERAHAIRERAFGPEHPETAQALTNVGIAALSTGDRARAHDALTRSIALLERGLGAESYNLAYALKGLGDTLARGGKPGEAVTHYERALAIWQANARGAHSREVGVLRMALATALGMVGRYDRARSELETALGELRAAYGDSDLSVIGCLNNLANLLAATGDLAAARAYQEQVVTAYERTAPDHPDLATGLLNLAETLRELGRYAEAAPLYRRSIEVAERAHGRDHPEVGFVLVAQAHAALAHRDHATALAAFERALPILAGGDDLALLGYTQLGLAQELWARDRARALQLADDAEATLTRAGPAGAEDLRALARWRSTRRK